MNLIRPKVYLTAVILFLCSNTIFAQNKINHYIVAQPISIAERHFGMGLGLGYELIAGKRIKYGISIPVNYYHGVFAQVGKPTHDYPDVKSRYATVTPTINCYLIYGRRFSYRVGVGAQLMYAYGRRAVQVNPANPDDPKYVAEQYAGYRFSGLLDTEFGIKMGKAGKNRFNMNFSFGVPLEDNIPPVSEIVYPMFRLNFGFAFAL